MNSSDDGNGLELENGDAMEETLKWHRRMGHCSIKYMERLKRNSKDKKRW